VPCFLTFCPVPSSGPTLFIVPTYNEVENIGELLAQTLRLPERVHVLVVDDASPDGTADLVAGYRDTHPDRVHLLRRDGKMGLGNAYRTGFRYALRRGYPFIGEMDADLSHNPADIPKLAAPLWADAADMTIGSRYVGGVRVMNWPLGRLILSYSAGIYTRAITRLPVQDVTAGFVCYQRRVLERLDIDRIRSTGYSFQIEMKYRAWRAGFRIAEVPIVFTERTEGQSKMSKAIVREAAWKVWELRLRDTIGRL